MAPSSRASYTRAVDFFMEFLKSHFQHSRLPASVQHVTAFIAFLSLTGKAPSTIATYISAIAYIHKVNLFHDPTDNFLVRKLIEGAKRSRVTSKDNRRPITFELLVKLINAVSHVTRDAYEAALFKAAFSLAFFAFLRVGEFTAKTRHSSTNFILLIQDIRLTQGGLYVTIRHAKNNQHNVPITMEIKALSRNLTAYCPVAIMSEYLHRRPAGGNDPLFVHFDSSPLTRFQFQSVLKKAVLFCDIEPSLYKSHSFRIGAATTLAMGGASSDLIKVYGRWKSAAYKSYIRLPVQVMSHAFINI